jgi:hypothetical protein
MLVRREVRLEVEMWTVDIDGSGLARLVSYWYLAPVGSVALVMAAMGWRLRQAGPSSRAERLAPLRAVKAEMLGRKGEQEVARRIAELGMPSVHDVVLTDDRGRTQIDHIVRTPFGIVVLETKRFSGVVTGTVSAALWRHEVGGGPMVVQSRGRRWRPKRRVPTEAVVAWFQNPLRQNYRHVMAVRRVIGDSDVPVRGHVVSAGPARFEWELAGAVIPLDRIGEILGDQCGERVDGRRLDKAWKRLLAAVEVSAGDDDWQRGR